MKKNLALTLIVSTILITGCGSMDPKYKYTEPTQTLRLTLLPHDAVAIGKETDVLTKISNIETRALIKDQDLDEVHTQKIHLLAIDPTLTDYQHIHPEPTGTPGLYHFEFTPKLPGNYRVWADVTPSVKHKQEYVMASFGPTKLGKVDRTQSNEATVGGYHFTLSFDKAPVEGGESMGTVHITDAHGAPVQSLQPVMGAYSHIVGFYDDFRTVVHSHPMGEEPKNDSQRGGPDLSFHMQPVKPGFVKLFVQVKINGKDVFAPFGVDVKPQAN